MPKKIIFIIFIAGILIGCSLPKLSIEKSDIRSGIIKTNGFYYNRPDYWSFIFYQNGVIGNGLGVSEKKIETLISNYSDPNFTVSRYNVPYVWGLFKITDDSIYIEEWESREWAAYGKHKFSGLVLNDSTLLLNHPVVGLDTFYFYYLPVKPDSTNKFLR